MPASNDPAQERPSWVPRPGMSVMRDQGLYNVIWAYVNAAVRDDDIHAPWEALCAYANKRQPAPAPADDGMLERASKFVWREPLSVNQAFAAFARSEVERATAELKARAEKAEREVAERGDRLSRVLMDLHAILARFEATTSGTAAAVTQAHKGERETVWFIENTAGLWLHKSGDQHTNVPSEAMSFRSRDAADRRIDEIARASVRPHATRSFYRPTSHLFFSAADIASARAAVTQAHEEAGARVARKTQEPPSEHGAQAGSKTTDRHTGLGRADSGGGSATTKEPPSAVGNTLPRAEPDGGGGSSTPTWAALRPWLAFVEALAEARVCDGGHLGPFIDAANSLASALLAARAGKASDA